MPTQRHPYISIQWRPCMSTDPSAMRGRHQSTGCIHERDGMAEPTPHGGSIQECKIAMVSRRERGGKEERKQFVAGSEKPVGISLTRMRWTAAPLFALESSCPMVMREACELQRMHEAPATLLTIAVAAICS
eukprot:GHVU01215322.1.p1 GENE.GHVU01215322.1~~GHVU01215322.1.p1  ORF type:complete len:132 (-),score=3.88 GHVU01215322.1:399-794(-)